MQMRYAPLTNSQWKVIKQFLNWKRKRKHSLRKIFNTIRYLNRTGNQWRNLSEMKFAHWNAVYYCFYQWPRGGTIDKINHALNQLERILKGRNPLPSLGLTDSQSIKSASMIYEHRGIYGNKKVNGRKRHILVGIVGQRYVTHVHAANLHDSPQGIVLLEDVDLVIDSLETIMTDKTYRGSFADEIRGLDIDFEVPERPNGTKGGGGSRLNVGP